MKEGEFIRIQGVDGQVILGASRATEQGAVQPEWLWFERDGRTVSLGRWPANSEQVPYVRLDIAIAEIERLRSRPHAADENRTL